MDVGLHKQDLLYQWPFHLLKEQFWKKEYELNMGCAESGHVLSGHVCSNLKGITVNVNTKRGDGNYILFGLHMWISS